MPRKPFHSEPPESMPARTGAGPSDQSWRAAAEAHHPLGIVAARGFPSRVARLHAAQSMRREPIALTVAGSRWSKNNDAPVSRPAMRAISSAVSSKSNTAMFSRIRSARTDFGMTTTSRWISQRKTTCATDFPCASPIAESVGSANRLFRPSANGPHDSIWTPRAHQLLVGGALEERMALDLVHRRDDLVVLDQVDEAVREEVRDADRADRPLAVERLHRPPRAVVVAEGLVDQVEVEVVEPELAERRLARAPRIVLAAVVDPHLRRDEELVARDAAAGDRPTD